MQLGPLEWTVRAPASYGALSSCSHADLEAFVRTLARLAERLFGLEWMVVSGLALPLACGRFFRAPSDIDIASPEHATRAVAVALRSAGYRVSRRLLVTRLACGRRLEVHAAIDPARCPTERLVRRRLRLRPHQGHRRGEAPILVELYPFRELDGGLEVERRLRLPRFDPLCELRSLPDGTPIPVENLAFVQYLKRRRSEAKHQFDLRLLSQLFGELDRAAAAPPTEGATSTS